MHRHHRDPLGPPFWLVATRAQAGIIDSGSHSLLVPGPGSQPAFVRSANWKSIEPSFAKTTKCCAPPRGASSSASACRARRSGTRPAEVDRETWLKAGREGLLCVTAADRIRRRRRRLRPCGGGGRGTAPRRRLGRGLLRCIRTSSRPTSCASAPRSRSSAGCPGVCSRRDHPGDRHDRARHRLGPEGDAHHRRARRRRLRHQRQQDLHQQRPDLRPGAAWSARPTRAPAPRASA